MAMLALSLLLVVGAGVVGPASASSSSSLADAAAPGVTCEQNVTVDPSSTTRIGSDYKWLAFSDSDTLKDCIKACCAETECQVWSETEMKK